MEGKQLISELNKLQGLNAPESLHGKIHASVLSLPQKHKGFYMPLFAFRAAIYSFVLLILLGAGGGVVLAANTANPGNILYPLKKAIISTQITFTKNPTQKALLEHEIQNPVTPTKVATPTPTVVPTKALKHEEVKNEVPTKTDEKKSVKGIQTAIIAPKTKLFPTDQQEKQQENPHFSWFEAIRKFFPTNHNSKGNH